MLLGVNESCIFSAFTIQGNVKLSSKFIMLIIKFEISVSSKEAEVSIVVTDFTHSIFSLVVSFCTLVAVNDSPSIVPASDIS